MNDWKSEKKKKDGSDEFSACTLLRVHFLVLYLSRNLRKAHLLNAGHVHADTQSNIKLCTKFPAARGWCPTSLLQATGRARLAIYNL